MTLLTLLNMLKKITLFACIQDAATLALDVQDGLQKHKVCLTVCSYIQKHEKLMHASVSHASFVQYFSPLNPISTCFHHSKAFKSLEGRISIVLSTWVLLKATLSWEWECRHSPSKNDRPE